MAFRSAALQFLLLVAFGSWRCIQTVRPELSIDLTKTPKVQSSKDALSPGIEIGKRLTEDKASGEHVLAIPENEDVAKAARSNLTAQSPPIMQALPLEAFVTASVAASSLKQDQASPSIAAKPMDVGKEIGGKTDPLERPQNQPSLLAKDTVANRSFATYLPSNVSDTVHSVLQMAAQRVEVFSPWSLLENGGAAAHKLNGTEIEHTFSKGNDTVHMNKVILVMVEMAIPCCGCFGLDRCIVGNAFHGIVKGMTCGGFFIWFIVDYVVIVINCLASEPEITHLGYDVQFTAESVGSAWNVCIFWILVTGAGYIPLGMSRLTQCAQNRRRRKEGEAIRQVFAQWDADHDGYLNLEDMLGIRRKLGLSVSRFDGLQMLKEMGKQEHEKVSADEFVDIVREGQCDLPPEAWETLRSAIKQHGG